MAPTFGVLHQRGHAALDEDGLVLEQGAHKTPRGQLAQQVDEQLHRALAVQQLLPVQRRLRRHLCASRGRHHIIQHLRQQLSHQPHSGHMHAHVRNGTCTCLVLLADIDSKGQK